MEEAYLYKVELIDGTIYYIVSYPTKLFEVVPVLGRSILEIKRLCAFESIINYTTRDTKAG